MIMLDVFAPPQVRAVQAAADTSGLNRVFAAAVVNQPFCETLLREPERALANGFLGQPFLLTDQEKALITTIRANSLADLARQVRRALHSGM